MTEPEMANNERELESQKAKERKKCKMDRKSNKRVDKREGKKAEMDSD